VRTLADHNVQKQRASSSRPPEEEAQVDYGSGPMVREPQSGKYRRTRLFVLTLGYSRKSVRLLSGVRVRASGPNCMRKRCDA